MNVRRRTGVVSICLAVMTVASLNASAMTCFRQSDGEIVLTAEVAFVGTALSQVVVAERPQSICRTYTPETPHCGKKITTFRVTEALRGVSAAQVSVLGHDSCSCVGPSFRVGQPYIVVANPVAPGEGADVRVATVCRGTGQLDAQGERLLRTFRETKQ